MKKIFISVTIVTKALAAAKVPELSGSKVSIFTLFHAYTKREESRSWNIANNLFYTIELN